MEEKNLTDMFEKNVKELIKDKVEKEIEEQVNNFREKLESQKDNFIAEVMKGIRMIHEYNPIDFSINYKIIFENVYKPKKTETTPYQPYTPVDSLDPLSIQHIPTLK